MRKLILLIIAVASIGFQGVANADRIKGTVTPVALGRACSNAGGSFNSNPTGYSCEKKNCNGRGGTCGVYCNKDGKCDGETPPIKTSPGSGRAGDTKNTVEGALMGGSEGKKPTKNTKNKGKLTPPPSKKIVKPKNKHFTRQHSNERAEKPSGVVKQPTNRSKNTR